MNKRNNAIIVAIALVAVAGGAAFAFRGQIRDSLASASKPQLPVATPYVPPAETSDKGQVPSAKPEVAPTPTPTPTPAPKPVVAAASEVNLAVPFVTQAPFGNWDAVHEETCEEATVVMAAAYFNGERSLTAAEADKRLLAAVDWENKTFGYYKDTTSAETARMAIEWAGVHATVKAMTSLDDAKRELAAGHVVILPAAGRELGNPYFSAPGPLYHMIVMKGYTKSGQIITNDSGTKRGADYVYGPAVLWAAIHDWNGGDVDHGAKVMIVVSK